MRVLVPARTVTRALGVVAQREARTPRYVVSSWTPPESVRTAAASASSERNSR